MAAEAQTQQAFPTPDPALTRLDRLVGTWKMQGHLVGSDEDNIKGEVTFRWLPGGFFLENRTRLDFVGLEVNALELIGYDADTDTFPSNVYSNFSPAPLPYEWGISGETLTISVSYGDLDARFEGTFSEDGERFQGGWRPNPGADETINVPYDIGGRRIG